MRIGGSSRPAMNRAHQRWGIHGYAYRVVRMPSAHLSPDIPSRPYLKAADALETGAHRKRSSRGIDLHDHGFSDPLTPYIDQRDVVPIKGLQVLVMDGGYQGSASEVSQPALIARSHSFFRGLGHDVRQAQRLAFLAFQIEPSISRRREVQPSSTRSTSCGWPVTNALKSSIRFAASPALQRPTRGRWGG